MKKVAVCLGINAYPNPANNLRGCVNDALDWAAYLRDKQDAATHILVNAKVKISYATQFISDKLKSCAAGDHFILTNSSHGSCVPDKNKDEVDGKDEVLCWYDAFLNDDLIRKIIDSATPGVNITIISDSCHSGTVTREFVSSDKPRVGYKRPKFITPDDPQFAAMAARLPVRKRAVSLGISEEQMREILISGCMSTEYSYDAFIKGKNNGAFTRYSLDVLYNSVNLTYNQFYQELRKKLPCGEYPQTPQLEGSSSNKNRAVFS